MFASKDQTHLVPFKCKVAFYLISFGLGCRPFFCLSWKLRLDQCSSWGMSLYFYLHVVVALMFWCLQNIVWISHLCKAAKKCESRPPTSWHRRRSIVNILKIWEVVGWPLLFRKQWHHMSRLMSKQSTNWLCAQRRLRSAWTSAHSDRSLRCALNGKLRTHASFMRTAKTLIRLGGFLGWSESSPGAQSFCWFCNEVAHFCHVTPN